MIDVHKLTIVPNDGTVVCENFSLTELNLSSIDIPEIVHALQWNNPLFPDKNNSHLIGLEYGQGTGWIELRSTDPNQEITQLPQWAIDAYLLAKSIHQNNPDSQT